MTQLELVISFRDKTQNFGLLGPDCTVAKIKDAALTITGAYGLGSSSQIMLNVTNPENKLKVVLDSDFGLECLLALYKRLGARVFKVDVVPVLCPQFQDAALFQALLTNLGVVLSDELITQVNDSIEGHASVEENPVVGGHAAMGGHASVVEHAAVEKDFVVRDDDCDEDALLSDCSDRRLSSDDDLDVNFMQADLDRAVDGAVDGASDGVYEY